ncbi:MAG: methyltransferase domain-containing protein [Vicinamibacteraceae bacterium]
MTAPETREWNAPTYHRVSAPQFGWGQAVLDRLPLRGDETVLDVGCGTGRLTSLLLDRLPRGRAIGIDYSRNMLATAQRELPAGVQARAAFVHADASALPVAARADAIFSTATFHWVLDHPRLFHSLFRALTPGGRLVAQCGGGANLHRHHERAQALMASARYAPFFQRWTDPWEFADAATTRARLEAVGFVDIVTRVTAAPVVQPDRDAFVEFVTHVIFRPHLAALPDDDAKRAFVATLADQAEADPVPFELDYWRLDFDARRPVWSPP